MAEKDEARQDLEDVLEEISGAADGAKEVSIADLQEAVGKRSFAPFLLIGGLIVLSPVGGIPGVPTIFGIIVLLTAGQLLIGRRSFWLPGIIARQAVDADRLKKGAEKIRKPARWVDALLKPRLLFLVSGVGTYAVAAASVLLALTMPALELVPFAVIAPAAAITAFALALAANDGLLALTGYAAAAASAYFAITGLVL